MLKFSDRRLSGRCFYVSKVGVLMRDGFSIWDFRLFVVSGDEQRIQISPEDKTNKNIISMWKTKDIFIHVEKSIIFQCLKFEFNDDSQMIRLGFGMCTWTPCNVCNFKIKLIIYIRNKTRIYLSDLVDTREVCEG